MSSRSSFVASAIALAILGLSACKTVYSDTFSYKKNNFEPPVKKQIDIKAPTEPRAPLDMGPGGMPPGGMPGTLPPDPFGIPGIPSAPAPLGMPGAAPAPPPAPGIPAIPGLN